MLPDVMTDDSLLLRFHPSRVYARWKWPLRGCLTILPALSVLVGGITLFLTPRKHGSSCVFELANGPSPQEITQLASSREVIARVVSTLELHKQLDVDRETAIQIVREQSEATPIPETKMIRLHAESTRQLIARDTAAELPRAILAHLTDIEDSIAVKKAGEMDELIRAAADDAEEKVKTLANLERIHGQSLKNEAEAIILNRAKRQSTLADAELERLRGLKNHYLTGRIEDRPRLVLHEEPVISTTPTTQQTDQSQAMGWILLRAVLQSLAAAILLPYALEWIFPRLKQAALPGIPAVAR